MEKLLIKGMKVFGYHGTKPEEQANGQDFLIDIEMLADIRDAADSDDPSNTVDIGQVYRLVKHYVKNNVFRLIEKLADNIAREILSKNEKVMEAKVTIKKPDAPLTGEFEYVGVELTRTRKDYPGI
jgi:dihydroneopterin aldolase